METKSRYEVIAELEGKKRDLIKERDGLKEQLRDRQNVLRDLRRKKEDNVQSFDRAIADAEVDAKAFEDEMEERKVTVGELIKSVDESLARFTGLGEKK